MAVLAIVFLSAGTASAHSRFYQGRTAQEGEISFLVWEEEGSLFLEMKDLTVLIDCTSSGESILVEFVFFGTPVPIGRDQRFELVNNDLLERFSLTGILSRHSARGQVSFALPAFDAEGEPQACLAEGTSWRARAFVPSARSMRGAKHTVLPLYRITVRHQADGSVNFHLEALAAGQSAEPESG